MADVAGTGAPFLSDQNVRLIKGAVQKHLREGKSPEALGNLAQDRPPLDFEYRILARTSRPKVYTGKKLYHCAFCQRENQFWAGFVLLCGDGKLRLIGADCAKLHVADGDRWTEDVSAFTYEERRERNEQVRIGLGAPAKDLLDQLFTTELLDVAKSYDGVVRRLYDKLPELVRALAHVNSQGGTLSVERLVVDEYQLSRRSPGDTRPDPKTSAPEIVGGLKGGWITEVRPHVLTDLQAAGGSLRSAREKLTKELTEKSSDEVYDKTVDSARADLVSAAKKAEKALRDMKGITAFLGQENVLAICRWANDDTSTLRYLGTFSACGRGILLERNYGSDVRVVLPRKLRPLEIEGLSALKDALARWRSS